MLAISDPGRQPSLAEISAYSGCALFDALCRQMADEFQALCHIEYSGDRVLLGWNVKFKKAGRTLCTLYPRPGHFFLLLVVGRKEKERAEEALPACSPTFRATYRGTREGMGQRWLVLDLASPGPVYDDALRLIRIRRQSK